MNEETQQFDSGERPKPPLLGTLKTCIYHESLHSIAVYREEQGKLRLGKELEEEEDMKEAN